MKKALKPITPSGKTPQTDAEALTDIVAWSGGGDRPQWQRQALKMLVQNSELTPAHLDELYQLSINAGVAPRRLLKGMCAQPSPPLR